LLTHITAPITAASTDPVAVSVAIVISGIAALLVATLLADRGGLLPESGATFGQWTATLAVTFSLGAAAIHFAVIGEHFAEYPPYGVAFTALAWFQVGWAVGWVVRRRRSVALSAIAINGGALAIWAMSRTVGLPIGPEPGELEPVGSLDVLAGVLEVALIGLLAWDLGSRAIRFRPALPAAGAIVVVGSVVLAVVAATSAALASAGADEHHHQAVLEPSAATDAEPTGTGGLAVERPADPSSSGAIPSPAPSLASEAPSAGADTAEPSVVGAAPSPAATPEATSAPTVRPTRSPGPTVRPPPPSPTVAPASQPGVIQFGSALDPGGQIAQPDNLFREGETAVWIADFREAPAVPEILKLIVQVLPDGREFEHWREQVAVSDPTATRLVGQAELSLYAHGGAGSYRLRYLRGDVLLAEGAFELVP